MTLKRPKFAPAVTLIEVMVAMVVLAIAAFGALSYQYYAATQARVAHAQTIAARTAQLLLEDWKSTGGSEDYDPTALNLGFYSSLSITPHEVSEGIPLHNAVYAVTVEDVPMLVTLVWKDVSYDSVAEITLRQLNVGVVWGREQQQDKVTLSTYVRLDASGG
jgi:prepilin-type N-terminal cleavage/methylation domain-containing protein